MKLRKFTAIAIFALLLPRAMSGCSGAAAKPGASVIDWNDRDRRAEQFVAALAKGDYSAAAAGFDKAMKKALSVSALKSAWEGALAEAGAYIGVMGAEIVPNDEYDIYNVVSRHEKRGVNTRVVFSPDGLVAGLFFSFVENADERGVNPIQKNGYVEIPVTIGEGTDYPLKGVITMPDGAVEKTPAVTLVHGSGPIDMDGTAFGVTVFKDIAEYLARNGIAALRYNKRTYSYGAKVAEQYGDGLTVREETIDDAILAKALLERQEGVDANRVFVLGHSLGGMLTPRIVSEGGFAGGVIMAGSPRSLIDIIRDQNLYFIGQMDISDAERDTLEKQVDEAKANFFGLL